MARGPAIIIAGVLIIYERARHGVVGCIGIRAGPPYGCRRHLQVTSGPAIGL